MIKLGDIIPMHDQRVVAQARAEINVLGEQFVWDMNFHLISVYGIDNYFDNHLPRMLDND